MSLQCEAIVEILRRDPLLPEVWAHLEQCPHCRARLKASRGAGPQAPARPEETMLERIRLRALEELHQHPRPTPWWREAVLLAALGLLMGLLGVVMMEPARLLQPPPGSFAVLVGGGLLILLMMGAAAVVAVMPRGRQARLLVLGLALVTGLVVGLGGHSLSDGRLYALTGLGCLMGELLVSLPPLAVSLWMLMRIAAHPLRTLAAGLGAGAAGLLALHLYCPIETAAHILTFHVLPWLALAALAVPLRQRLPSRSFAP